MQGQPQTPQAQQQDQQQDGGRRGDPRHEGGAAQDGHLDPQIDAKDKDLERQPAQQSQQSSGSGWGQS